eukprot:UN04465
MVPVIWLSWSCITICYKYACTQKLCKFKILDHHHHLHHNGHYVDVVC